MKGKINCLIFELGGTGIKCAYGYYYKLNKKYKAKILKKTSILTYEVKDNKEIPKKPKDCLHELINWFCSHKHKFDF